eukprot:597600-Hanusia_phi.AAC.2
MCLGELVRADPCSCSIHSSFTICFTLGWPQRSNQWQKLGKYPGFVLFLGISITKSDQNPPSPRFSNREERERRLDQRAQECRIGARANETERKRTERGGGVGGAQAEAGMRRRRGNCGPRA